MAQTYSNSTRNNVGSVICTLRRTTLHPWNGQISKQMQLIGVTLWSERCMLENLAFTQYVAVELKLLCCSILVVAGQGGPSTCVTVFRFRFLVRLRFRVADSKTAVL